MFASPEFVALCQTQVALLTEGFGATLSIVYLTEEVSGEALTDLVPIAAHPEAVLTRDRNAILSLLALDSFMEWHHRAPASSTFAPRDTGQTGLPAAREPHETANAEPVVSSPNKIESALSLGAALPASQRMMLPLVHGEEVLGVLVTARADRPWAAAERSQIEHIAETLAIACVMDQRAAWTDHTLHNLEQLQGVQHELFDNLLHQFSSPLTALRTFGKLLLKRLSPTNRSREFAESIVRESEHLQDLLAQFKQVANLQPMDVLMAKDDPEAETLDILPKEPLALPDGTARSPLLLPGSNTLTGTTLHPVTCDLEAVVTPLLASARAIAQDRQITLQSIIPPHLPPVMADLQALREALNNLIDNALKYTPSGGHVEILLGLRRISDTPTIPEKWQGIAVIDNGPGIPLDDQTHLFERHFRGIQADSSIPGTGLGLAITRDLIQQMQGSIEVYSPAIASGLLPDDDTSNPGTALIVWLPEATSALEDGQSL